MAMSTGKVVALIQAMGGGADPAVIKAAVQDWLDAHPEATTTVQDGSITEQKLATSIAQKLGLISSLSDEIESITDGLTLVQGQNLVNPEQCESNTYYSKGGTKNTNQNNYSAFILDNPEIGATYTYWKRNGTAVWNEANSKATFVTVYVDGVATEALGATSVHSFTVPEVSAGSTVTRIIFSVYNADGSIANYGMIVKGTDAPSGYVAYVSPHYVATDDFFPDAMTVCNVHAYGAIGDGETDDSNAIQAALTAGAGGIVYIPKGVYIVSKALTIPDKTSIIGAGIDATVIKLPANYNQYGFTALTWREQTAYSFITTAENSTGILLEGFTVDGGTKNTVDAVWGITIYKSSNCVVEKCCVKNINYNASRTGEAYAFGLFVYNSENVTIRNGKYAYCGYENIGGEVCNNVIVDDCFIGTAWRVPIQFHQNSHNIKIINCTIESLDCAMTHSLITLHGRATNGFEDCVSDVLIANNKLHGITINQQELPYRGGIQSVWQNEQNVIISGNTFDCSYYCIANATDRREGTYVNGGWIISGNYIKGAYGINIWDDNVMVIDNIIDSSETAIAVKTKTVNAGKVIAQNIFMDNNTTTDSVTR